jgi:hypothetical protein
MRAASQLAEKWPYVVILSEAKNLSARKAETKRVSSPRRSSDDLQEEFFRKLFSR